MRLVADCRAGSGLPKGLSLGSGLQPFMHFKVKIASKIWQRVVAIAWLYAHGVCCTAQALDALLEWGESILLSSASQRIAKCAERTQNCVHV